MYSATIEEEALKPKTAGAYYSRQKLLFILAMVLVSVIPLIGISYFTFNFYRSSWLENTSSELATLTESRKQIIELFLADQNDLLSGIVDLYSPEYLSDQSNLEQLFKSWNSSGVITDLGLIDASGAHVSYVGPFRDQLSDKNYAGEVWFSEAMRRGNYTSDIFSGFRGVPHFVVAVADPSKQFILRATVNSDMFNSLLASADVGEGGDAFILNRRGELQTPSRLGSSNAPFMLEGSDGSTQMSQDNDFIYAAAPLKGGDWLLVLQEDTDSTLSQFFSARNSALILIGLAIVLIASVAAVVTISLMNRIKDADSKRTELNNRLLEMERMALVGRLASSVSHEINNPLQIIESQAGWIEELLQDEKPGQLPDAGEYEEAVQKIRTHVQRAKRITHRLLGFSHAGERPVTSTDINTLVQETVSFLESEAASNGINIKQNLAEDLPQTATHPNQLQQVLLNIINNAMDAIGKDGTITVATHRSDAEIITEISDTGPGLGDELRRNVFDPFFTTKNGRNAGLGLSISYSIMQRLHGRIEVANGPRGGAMFSVILPLDGAGMPPQAGEQVETMAKRGEQD
jgi:two-component system NtrC family sensor kinase